MGDDNTTAAHIAAHDMIDTFRSVGATRFDVTLTTAAGEKDSFRRGVSLSDLTRTLPGILDAAATTQRNVIVRPHSPNTVFVQLDDLKAAQLAPLAPAVFLTLETSPDNFQAWAALRGMEDKDFARRLRKGTGADATASGATRVAGSLNFKDKYAPDFPRVRISTAQPGRTTTTAELERLGLVAPPEEVTPLHVAPVRSVTGSNRKCPELCKGARRRAAQQRRHWPRCEPGGFCVCDDHAHMGFRPRGNRRAAAAGKQQGAVAGQRLRRAYRS